MLPKEDLSLHLVEISPKMSELQADKLTSGATGPDEDMNVNGQPHQQDRGSPYRSACSKTGVPVHWYDTLSKVPRGTYEKFKSGKEMEGLKVKLP